VTKLGGELDCCLVVVDKWMEAAGTASGSVFQGIFKGGGKLRPGRISLRAIEYMTTAYPYDLSILNGALGRSK
jgi:hypothetical protein